MAKIKIDTKKLDKAIAQSFRNVSKKIGREMTAVIEDPNEFADLGISNHDIVLSGDLRDSQDESIEDNRAEWEYDPRDRKTGEQYALNVYTGFFAYDNPRNNFYPGRRWPERAMKRVNPVESLAQELRSQGLSATVRLNRIDELPD